MAEWTVLRCGTAMRILEIKDQKLEIKDRKSEIKDQKPEIKDQLTVDAGPALGGLSSRGSDFFF